MNKDTIWTEKLCQSAGTKQLNVAQAWWDGRPYHIRLSGFSHTNTRSIRERKMGEEFSFYLDCVTPATKMFYLAASTAKYSGHRLLLLHIMPRVLNWDPSRSNLTNKRPLWPQNTSTVRKQDTSLLQWTETCRWSTILDSWFNSFLDFVTCQWTPQDLRKCGHSWLN